MRQQAELMTEVAKVVDEAPNNTPLSWIVHKVVDNHVKEERKKRRTVSDFWLHCAYEHVRDTVRAYLASLDAPARVARDQADLFPALSRVRGFYAIEREGEARKVTLSSATNAELREKAKEYRMMGAGCIAHGDELDRYVDAREEAERQHFAQAHPARFAQCRLSPCATFTDEEAA